MGHVLGLDEGVEFFGGDEAELDGGFAEADVLFVGGLGDFGGVVVADFGGQGGDQHQRIVDVAVDGFAVGFDAANAVLDKAVGGLGAKLHPAQVIENTNRA